MSSGHPSLTQQHLKAVRDFYDAATHEPKWAAGCYRRLLAHYYNLLIPADASVLEIGCGSGDLLARLNGRKKVDVDLSSAQITAARHRLPQAEFYVQAGEQLDLTEVFDYIVISDTLNLAADVQQLLERLHRVSHSDARLILNYHSALWRPVIFLSRWMGFKTPESQSSWLASSDVRNLLDLANWNALTFQHRLIVPFSCFGIERLINRWLAPVFSWGYLKVFCVARPGVARDQKPLLVSVIIPARNESGNIEATIRRTPQMGAGTELIFVEGHSRDNTRAQIQRVALEARVENQNHAADRPGQRRRGPARICRCDWRHFHDSRC